MSWRTSGSRSLQTLATVPMLLDQLLDQAGPHMVRQSVMVHLSVRLDDFHHLYWRTITLSPTRLSPSLLADFWQLSLVGPLLLNYTLLRQRPLDTLACLATLLPP